MDRGRKGDGFIRFDRCSPPVKKSRRVVVYLVSMPRHCPLLDIASLFTDRASNAGFHRTEKGTSAPGDNEIVESTNNDFLPNRSAISDPSIPDNSRY